MIKFLIIISTVGCLSACGNGQEQGSKTANFLEGGGWKIESSPFNLAPGSTIGVCDRGRTGKGDLIVDAVRIWLKAGGRDGRLRVVQSCVADRVIQLVKLNQEVDFYGRAHPLVGNVNNVDVPRQWAGHWTANHEVGHIFGFGHIFKHTVSIMNSEENGKYMNGGELSDYDLSEVRRMLSSRHFAAVNKLWAKPSSAEPVSVSSAPVSHPATPRPVAAPPAASPPSQASSSCLGADRSTRYSHGIVTTYQGNTYTCNNGRWVFSAGA